MGQTLDYFCKGTEFTQSHRPEEAVPDSCDTCKPGFRLKLGLLYIVLEYLLNETIKIFVAISPLKERTSTIASIIKLSGRLILNKQ